MKSWGRWYKHMVCSVTKTISLWHTGYCPCSYCPISNSKNPEGINNVKSSRCPLRMGVPLGSILGPLLFLLYTNDLHFYVKNLCDVVLFADG